MVTVQARIAGGRRSLAPDIHVPIGDLTGSGGSPLTLRDLIGTIVRREVDAFRTRQRDGQLVRALSATEIQIGAEGGAIRSGGVEAAPQEVDEGSAVATALEAFEDGLYYAFVDRTQVSGLDEQVFVAEDSTVVFLRLVPLAGG